MDFFLARDLPPIFDPVLNYLSDNLPRPLYNTIVNLLSHTLAILYGLFNLATSLKTWKPWEWDAQTILPPLISILAAYYALISMYRTTGWMLRMGIRMVKWGTILAAIFAGIGWMMGNNPEGAAGFMQSMLGGQDTRASSRHGTRNRPSPSTRQRPRPWEAFEAHRQWQYEEDQNRAYNDNAGGRNGVGDHAQRVMDEIIEIVGRGAGDGAANFFGTVWNTLKNAGDFTEWINSGANRDAERNEAGASSARRTQPPRKAKSTAQAKRTTRSR